MLQKYKRAKKNLKRRKLTSEKIGEEELQLMERDFSGKTEYFKELGYRTEESFIVNYRRIPLAGLSQVSYNRVYLGGRTRLVSIGMNFLYEDGTKRQAEIIASPENTQDIRLQNFIGSSGREVRVYKEQ